MGSAITVRRATPGDVGEILAMIRALAECEHLAEQCVIEAEALRKHLFGHDPAAEVLIAEIDSSAAGFALFFTTYSTFLGKPGLWLEDLFVLAGRRGKGLGRALLGRLAETATARGYGRLEWAVLDANRSAIAFYHSLGADLMDDWTTCRVTGEDLATLARHTSDTL